MELAQINTSVSQRGVIRGIHAAHNPPGQAKYVMCVSGHVLDLVVDLRIDSPTFGRHDAVFLDDSLRNAVFISEGLGHGFQVISESATVVYVTSSPYNPECEFAINPLDPTLNLPWVTPIIPVVSDRDLGSPRLGEFFRRD